MATQNPVRSSLGAGVSQVQWGGDTAVADGDTIVADLPSGTEPVVGSVQVTGTFGAAVTLQASDDGTNFVTLKDLGGSDISFTSAGRTEFSTAAAYIKPAEAGVTGVVVTVTLRG
jgi:hypothetical protein